jgi:hypothetical protein
MGLQRQDGSERHEQVNDPKYDSTKINTYLASLF